MDVWRGSDYMVVLVKWNFNLFVNEGKPLTLGDRIDGITAYDKLSIKVPSETGGSPTGLTIDLQPSDVDKIVLLCIKSDHYPKSGTPERLYYTLEKVAGAKENDMNGPHVLLGNTLVKLLGDDLTQLKFVNTTGADANVDIVVGRKA
jgi:hypothetical protein